MAKCPDPKCHEEMQLKLKGKVKYDDFNSLKRCVGHKVSKKVVWVVFVVVVLPLLVTGIKVWSGQEADPLRYATKDELATCNKDVVETKILIRQLKEDMREVKRGQEIQVKDTKEILRYLRDSR